MEFEALALMLAGKFPIVGMILSILGMLVIVGQVIVTMTPSKADDLAWEKIKAMPILGQLISVVAAFAPIQKK